MKTLVKYAAAATLTGALALAAVTPSEARDGRNAALIGGIAAGALIGAAVANANSGYYYGGPGYYAEPGYAYQPSYAYQPGYAYEPGPVYVDPGPVYYAPRYRYYRSYNRSSDCADGLGNSRC